MTPLFSYRPRARLDLLEQFLYLAENAGVEVAERYYAAVERTCNRLARQPLSGTRYDSEAPRLKGMRRAPVTGFKSYLVFYLPHAASGIEIVRVLHGARDIPHLLPDEESQ